MAKIREKFSGLATLARRWKAGGRAEKGHNESLSAARQPAYTPHDKWTDVMRTQHGRGCRPGAHHCTGRAADLLTFKAAGGALRPPAGMQPASVFKG